MEENPARARRPRNSHLVGAGAVLVLVGAVFTLIPQWHANEVRSFEVEPSHTEEVVEYDQDPPVGGPHSPVMADCSGTVYTEVVPPENAVHSLEHGAVWVTYRPGLAEGELEQLVELVEENDYTLLSPYPGLEEEVTVQSWGKQLRLEDLDLGRVEDFVETYKRGPDTPEPEAGCSNPEFLESRSVTQP